MWLAFLSDPVFIIAVFIFIGIMACFYWFLKREKERALEERLKQIEKTQQEKNEKEK